MRVRAPRRDGSRGREHGRVIYAKAGPSRRNGSARASDRGEDSATPQKLASITDGTEAGAYGPAFLASGSLRTAGGGGRGPTGPECPTERGQGDTRAPTLTRILLSRSLFFLGSLSVSSLSCPLALPVSLSRDSFSRSLAFDLRVYATSSLPPPTPPFPHLFHAYVFALVAGRMGAFSGRSRASLRPSTKRWRAQ